MIGLPGKVVSLLEILRAHVDLYVKTAYLLGLLNASGEQAMNNDTAELFGMAIRDLVPECEQAELVCSLDGLHRLQHFIEHPELWFNPAAQFNFASGVRDVSHNMELELRHRLFLQVSANKAKYYDQPQIGWEEISERFPEAITDIEECSKCFALSRYAAAVFHAVNAVECGLIELGRFIKVKDPKSGWAAVTGELDRLVAKTKFTDLDPLFQQHFGFLEQVHGTIASLKNSWRNKISHTQGRLTLMTVEFSPDVAEEIILASRGFMRRLATEMPSNL